MKKHFGPALLFLCLFVTAASAQNRKIADIIRPIRLTAGVGDSVLVSDLFYADNYDVKFYKSPDIQTGFDKKNNVLYLKPDSNFEGLGLIKFSFGGEDYSIPFISSIKTVCNFKYNTNEKPKRVNLFGSFNGWNRENLPMTDEGEGKYTVKVPLEPGRYEYKFYVDGKEIIDPANPDTVPNGLGGINSVITVKPRHSGSIYLHILGKKISGGVLTLSYYFNRSNLKSPVAYDNLVALIGNSRISSDRIKINGNKIDIVLKQNFINPNSVIRLAVNSSGESSNMHTVYLNNGVPAGGEKNVRLRDQVIYSIMTDRFCDGDKKNDKPVVMPGLSYKANYQGGDFQGIIDKINSGYFNSLGVNTLWISPVVDNPDSAYRESPPPHRYYTGYHGYWPLRVDSIEERFGTMALLKNLVADAHKHGIKILIDYVSHHVFNKNRIYKEHRDWFGNLYLPDGRMNLRMWDDHRLTTWFEPYLPTFDYIHSKDAREFMTDNAVWLLKETGADGFRHDAVKHVPNIFWRTLTKKLKREIEIPEKRNIYQIGETFGSYNLVDSYVNNGQLNAQFDFNLYDTAIPTFIDKNGSFLNLAAALKKSFAVYGVNSLMGNIMDSHDKVRFMAYADGDVPLNGGDAAEIGWENPPHVDHSSSYKKMELYLAYMLTIPGIPVIDYGDEIGMTGAADPDNRRMMKFGNELSEQQSETLREVSKIIKTRDKNSALRYGDFQTIDASKDVLVYLRSDMNERVLVCLNKSGSSVDVNIALPGIYKIKTAQDALSGKMLALKGNMIKFTVPGIGFRIIKLN